MSECGWFRLIWFQYFNTAYIKYTRAYIFAWISRDICFFFFFHIASHNDCGFGCQTKTNIRSKNILVVLWTEKYLYLYASFIDGIYCFNYWDLIICNVWLFPSHLFFYLFILNGYPYVNSRQNKTINSHTIRPKCKSVYQNVNQSLQGPEIKSAPSPPSTPVINFQDPKVKTVVLLFTF